MHAKPAYDSIICFGDSLTQQGSMVDGGFVKELQKSYIRIFDIYNRGYGGYTSRQALALCPILFEQNESPNDGKAQLATIWFGTNDAIQPGHTQHVPLEEYRSNMKTILTKYFSSIPVLLITPTTCVPGIFDGHLDDSLHAQYGTALKEIAYEINLSRSGSNDGVKNKVVVIDMREEFLNASKNENQGLKALFQEDGLHISSKGYQIVFDSIMQSIEKHFPTLMPDGLSFVIPDWKILNLSLDPEGQMKQLQPKK